MANIFNPDVMAYKNETYRNLCNGRFNEVDLKLLRIGKLYEYFDKGYIRYRWVSDLKKCIFGELSLLN